MRGSQFTAPNRSQLLAMTGAVNQVGRAEVGRRGREKGQGEKAERKSRKRASRGLKLGETLFNARLNSRRIQTLLGEHLWNLAVFDETVVEAKI